MNGFNSLKNIHILCCAHIIDSLYYSMSLVNYITLFVWIENKYTDNLIREKKKNIIIHTCMGSHTKSITNRQEPA